MVERFVFPANAASIHLIAVNTRALRKAGFKTRLVESTYKGTSLLVLVATPPFRPNRKARGCDVR